MNIIIGYSLKGLKSTVWDYESNKYETFATTIKNVVQ